MAVKYCRAEIDTSAPIESVKDAAIWFGGIGYWKPQIHPKPCLEADFEEQAIELEKEMFEIERETLEVLHELEKTKSLVEQFKTRIQKETSELNDLAKDASNADGDEHEIDQIGGCVGVGIPSSSPGFVLLELKRAKANFVKTTNDINHLRADVVSVRIGKERKALEMTPESLTSNVSLVSCLEKELNDANEKLKFAKEFSANEARETANRLSKDLERLNAETVDFKKVGRSCRVSEVLKAMSETETTTNKLHIVEMSLIAAQKIKEASRASEALAVVDLKALTNVDEELSSEVTLSAAEYSLLLSKAREAEVKRRLKVEDAMFEEDDARLSKIEILSRVGYQDGIGRSFKEV